MIEPTKTVNSIAINKLFNHVFMGQSLSTKITVSYASVNSLQVKVFFYADDFAPEPLLEVTGVNNYDMYKQS